MVRSDAERQNFAGKEAKRCNAVGSFMMHDFPGHYYAADAAHQTR